MYDFIKKIIKIKIKHGFKIMYIDVKKMFYSFFPKHETLFILKN